MAESKRKPTSFDVPAGSRPSQCNGPSCRATIYWITNPVTGRMMPVSCDVEGGETPSETTDRRQADLFCADVAIHDGRGVSHFTTCPDAEFFSGRNRR